MTREVEAVRFVRGHSPYTRGDVAGFPPAKAAHLIRTGAAVPYQTVNRQVQTETPAPAEPETATETAPAAADKADSEREVEDRPRRRRTRNRALSTD